MSDPSVEAYLAASEAVYGETEAGGVELGSASPSESKLLSDSQHFLAQEGITDWTPLSVDYVPQIGLYATAFLTDTNKIIISYEGTLNNDNTEYGLHTLRADKLEISLHSTPTELFNSALRFANKIVDYAVNILGIRKSYVSVTGHSLGGAEAEYVAANKGLGGAAFGAPGLPGYHDEGQNNNFTTYVDYADPIGNYASGMRYFSIEGYYAPSGNMDHVGNVHLVGLASNAAKYANALGPNAIFVNFDELVDDYHLIGNYAEDLKISPLRPLGASSDREVIFSLDYDLSFVESQLGHLGKGDIKTEELYNKNRVGTNDFFITADQSNNEIIIRQNSDLKYADFNKIEVAGTYVIDLSPSDRGVVGDVFTNRDTGAVKQFIPDNNPASKNANVSFLRVSDDTLIINYPHNYAGAVLGFVPGDRIDLPGIGTATSATLDTGDVLAVQENNGNIVSLNLDPSQNYAGDLFEVAHDGSGGTDIKIATLSVSPSNPSVNEDAGSETFTLTRAGNASEATTVYVSTTDGSTVPGEDINSGDFSPLSYQPVTFAAGSSTAQVGVAVNDLGLSGGSTKTFGIQVTDDQSNNNVLATDQFAIVDNDPAPAPPITVATYDYAGNPLDPFYPPGGPSIAGITGAATFYIPSGYNGDISPVSESFSAGGVTLISSSAASSGAGFSFENGQIVSWDTGLSQVPSVGEAIGTLYYSGGSILNQDFLQENSGIRYDNNVPGAWTLASVSSISGGH